MRACARARVCVCVCVCDYVPVLFSSSRADRALLGRVQVPFCLKVAQREERRTEGERERERAREREREKEEQK